MDHQPVLVGEIMGDQRLHELRGTHDHDVLARLTLDLCDPPGDVGVTVVCGQEPAAMVLDATYLGTALSIRAMSSSGSVTVGQ